MKFSRLYERTAEFRSRCMAFDFAVVAHAVMDAAIAAKKGITNWWKKNRPTVKHQVKKPHQLVLELDSIAPIPMFRTCDQ